MKRNVFTALLIALAIVALVEAALLFRLHTPFLLHARDDQPEATEFEVLDDPFSRSRMATSNASPGGSSVFPNAFGTVGGTDPFAEMERMRREMDERMREVMRQVQSGGGAGIVMTLPDDVQQEISTIDVDPKDDRYVCTLHMQGVDEDSIRVTVEAATLTIGGKRTIEKTEERQGRIIAHISSTEQFSRSTELPGPVKASCMRTAYKDGVLTVELPKAAQGAEAIPLPLP